MILVVRLALLLMLTVGGASAQVAKVATGGGAPPPAPTGKQSSLAERRSGVEAKLEDARARAASVPGDVDEHTLPSGANLDEWYDYRATIDSLVGVYANHLDSLDELIDLSRLHRELDQQAESWQGFPDPPPYSVTFIDDLWAQTVTKSGEVETVRIEANMFDGLVEDAREQLTLSQQALRQAREKLEEGTADRLPRLRWLADLAELRERFNEARLGGMETVRELISHTLSYRLDERDLLEKKALTASRKSPLTEADRDARVAELLQRKDALQKEIDQLTTQDTAINASFKAALLALNEAREHAASAPPGQATSDVIRSQEDEIDTLRSEVEGAGATLRMLRLLSQGLTEHQYWWERRYRLENTHDPAIVEDGAQSIRTSLDRVIQWRSYLAAELDSIRRQIDDRKLHRSDRAVDAAGQQRAEREIKAYQKREAATRRALAELDTIYASLWAGNELVGLRIKTASFRERLAGRFAQARDIASAMWNFEVLAIEDTVVVEGREIVGKRSVTLGKIIEVLLILGIGFWLINRIASLAHPVLLRLMRRREGTALLLHRMLSILMTVSLVVFALITASIPLTVFAFLGGAVAIGLGFGAQNILNNFISGLILLVERPIKPGDVVEIEGIRGTVVNVGGRCCQIHRFDGIDMLIPNSSFLEKSVTNWTLSDSRVRCTLTVGIAYGSSVDQALSLVGQIVDQNSSVLKFPAATVYLQDFASDSLLLRLDFWVDLSVEPNQNRVCSDIRRRIDELFRQHRIPIAFPQRDVHLDAVAPLRVEVVKADNGAREGAINEEIEKNGL